MDLSRYTLLVNILSSLVVLIYMHYSVYYDSFQLIVVNYTIYVPMMFSFSLGTGT